MSAFLELVWNPFTNNLDYSSIPTNPPLPNSYVNVTNAMSPYTVTDSDYFISVDATDGPVTILLPNSTRDTREIVVKDRLGQSQINNIIVTTPGSVTTIDQDTSYLFDDPYEAIDMLYHSGNYQTF